MIPAPETGNIPYIFAIYLWKKLHTYPLVPLAVNFVTPFKYVFWDYNQQRLLSEL